MAPLHGHGRVAPVGCPLHSIGKVGPPNALPLEPLLHLIRVRLRSGLALNDTVHEVGTRNSGVLSPKVHSVLRRKTGKIDPAVT